MDELLARAMQGVDPDAPGATVTIFLNLMAMIPWVSMIWLTVGFTVVGGLLGWWRGRLWLGITSALLLGPFGWLVIVMMRRPASRVPPLPSDRSAGRKSSH